MTVCGRGRFRDTTLDGEFFSQTSATERRVNDDGSSTDGGFDTS